MNLNALEDFLLVAAHGGLGKASRASGRSKATLSRRIADLEEALGVRLLERGANRLILTEAGHTLLARAEDPMREVGEAMTAAREGLAQPRGCLRIAAPLLFSQLAFGALGAKFLAAYPDVQLDVVAQDRAVDLVEEHFDVAIRVNPSEDSTLVGHCFAKDRLMIVAAPSIKKPRAGKDGKPVPLPAVVLSSYAGEPWPIDGRRVVVDPQPAMRASSLLIVRDAALAGVGVAVLPRSIIGSRLRSGELVAWGTTGKPVELWALHTSRRLPSAKVRAFVDFMRDQYPDGELVLQG
jgi:DNA-binding transcriptional LysR family regulator